MKHWGRIQYGLFLKGIGLTLEQSLKFWRSEFTKMMDVDKVGNFCHQCDYSLYCIQTVVLHFIFLSQLRETDIYFSIEGN